MSTATRTSSPTTAPTRTSKNGKKYTTGSSPRLNATPAPARTPKELKATGFRTCDECIRHSFQSLEYEHRTATEALARDPLSIGRIIQVTRTKARCDRARKLGAWNNASRSLFAAMHAEGLTYSK